MSVSARIACVPRRTGARAASWTDLELSNRQFARGELGADSRELLLHRLHNALDGRVRALRTQNVVARCLNLRLQLGHLLRETLALVCGA